MRHRGRTALVTGANRGLGLACARGLLELGYRTVVAGRSSEALSKAAAALRQGGGDVVEAVLDVTSPEHLASLLRRIEAGEFEIDILINCAGIMHEGQEPPSQTDPAVFRETLETNLHGPVRLMQALLPKMAARRWGRAVNVSSEMGSFPSFKPYASAYRISKTALNAATRLAALEWQRDGILINAVCPGWIRTDLGGPDAPRSVEEGAASVLWAVRLPDDGPTGGFFRDGARLPF